MGLFAECTLKLIRPIFNSEILFFCHSYLSNVSHEGDKIFYMLTWVKGQNMKLSWFDFGLCLRLT